jgi:hypothetical protein
LSSTPTQLTYKETFTAVSVNNETHKVERSVQMEEVAKFTPIGPQIRRDASVKTFDQNGSPLSLSTNYTLAKRVAPFHSVDTYNGKDMKAMFRNYLNDHGLGAIAPD